MPLRYALIVNDETLFTIGSKTHLFLKESDFDEESPLDEQLKKIAKKEFHSLLEDLVAYLAKREVSPRKLTDWFFKRKVHPRFEQKLRAKIKKNGFYVPLRFLTHFLEYRFETAKKPWWLVKQELLREGFSRDEIEQNSFNDLLMLKDFYRNKKIPPIPLFEKKLKNRGFDYETIRSLIAFLKQNQNLD